MADLADKTLGEFRMLRLLGSGGMAEVYLAEQVSLQRNVAVKVMKPELMAASGETMLARFKQEAMMAAGLNHPNIVQVYTIGEDDGYHFIAQEFVQGKDLASILKSKGVPDLGSCLHVIRQVASALKASGQAGIVHRDIKPENILVNKKGEVKVADFGLAQLHDNRDGGNITREGMTLGTPHYMSPEQVSGKELDPRSDVYSMGVTCYQMLCGKTPFQGSSPMAIAVQHLNTLPPQLGDQNPKLPDVVCRMIHRMMAKRRSLRYQSASDVYSDLKVLISGFKQGRDLSLIKLPILEELEHAAEKAKTGGGKSQSSDSATRTAPRKAARKKADFDIAPGGLAADPLDEFSSNYSSDESDSYDSSYDDTPTQSNRRTKQAAKTAAKQAVPTSKSIVTVTLPSWLEEDDEDLQLGRDAPDFEEMDLTPMVDVTFLLLIFFMITASFNLQKKIDVPPATSNESSVSVAPPENAGIEAQIDANNVVWIGDVSCNTREDVLRALKSEKSNSDSVELKLQIDPESMHGRRILVADAAAQAGFVKISSKISEVD